MARLVRRQPLLARIKSYLNPLDFLLWLSEEIDSNDWDQFHRTWATPVGLILNMSFLIARSNSGQGHSLRGKDDVFGDDAPGGGYMPWFVRDPPPLSDTHRSFQLINIVVHGDLNLDRSLRGQRQLHLLPQAPLPSV